ncbi:MAG TPA: 4'-phosphopantetheinyl transferase superfamily protein [Methylomirabilota bacterium]|nr:4'-phosphopantetheinyl transferase superfamily protein [Methylomirabilota bacterium]
MATRRLTWEPSPAICTLCVAEVHVWRVALTLPDAQLAALHNTLSTDERVHAAQFRFPRDRRRFIARRGALRVIVSRYVEEPPNALSFYPDPAGKPTLITPAHASWLHFSTSHSHELALIAVALGQELGVDLERIIPEIEVDEIAAHFFSPQECSALQRLSGEQKIKAFFHCWTRKEAVLKAQGLGLTIPLQELTVSVSPKEPRVLHYPQAVTTRWVLYEPEPGDGYVGALAVAEPLQQVRYWEWSL